MQLRLKKARPEMLSMLGLGLSRSSQGVSSGSLMNRDKVTRPKFGMRALFGMPILER
jgi:hypothetical protein